MAVTVEEAMRSSRAVYPLNVEVCQSLPPSFIGVKTNFVVVPHGVAYEEFKAASENPPPVMQISEASIAFMFESSRPFTITDYAWNSDKKHEHEPKMWDNLVDNFSKHAREVEEILAKKAKNLTVSS